MDFNKYDYVEPKGVNGKILITSFVEDKEFDKLCNKKQFIENIYKHNIKWYHLPVSDLAAPESEFKHQWQTKKVLLKKELISGTNIVLHCWGGKGRAGTVAAILLIEFGENKNEAINIVRAKRKGAIESKAQKDFILSYRPIN